MADPHNKPAVNPPVGCPVTPPQRRSFFIEAMAVLIGGVVAIFPFAAGLFAFFDPLRRTTGGGKHVRVAALDAVPDDGLPHPFAIIADVTDAWTLLPDEPIGRVYLIRKKGSDVIEALSATCPHLGCMVGYDAAEHLFRCPCHTSAFDLNGKRRLDISKVPPRNMDTLTCNVENGEVWVDYVNYKTGFETKIPRG